MFDTLSAAMFGEEPFIGESEARDQVFKIQMLAMGITVAHELVHAFVGFLTGTELPMTPSHVSFVPEFNNRQCSDGTVSGHSGYAWEAKVFGGFITYVAAAHPPELDDHPLGKRQAGELWLVNEDKKARMIDIEAMGDIGCLGKKLNSPCIPDH